MTKEYIEILKLIGLFQALEISLKVYIGHVYHIINKEVSGKLIFKYSYNDLSKHSLERLITIFAKLNDNSDLQKRLNTLKEYRNHVAHKSLALASPAISDNIKTSFLGYSDNPFDYSLLNEELNDCLAILLEEEKKLISISNQS